MLKHTSHKPDEIVGRMRPTNFREYWAYDVEKVAVNAVMAGARPEYFPAILAMAGEARGQAFEIAFLGGPALGRVDAAQRKHQGQRQACCQSGGCGRGPQPTENRDAHEG